MNGIADDEVRSLAQAVMAVQKPAPEAREVSRLLLDMELMQLRERSEFLEAAFAEAERAGDDEAIERLQLEIRFVNETRRSIDLRREDTRLLARPNVAVHA